MFDVAIVGAGLTGLSLARQLHAQGQRVVVFEARPRAGGRILTDVPGDGGAALDLGASWYWPETEPRVTALIAELGLRSIAQPDTGTVLHLSDASRAPEAMDTDGIHGGARRLLGGMQALIEALLSRLPPGTVQLGQAVRAVQDLGDHIELQLAQAAAHLAGPDGVTALNTQRHTQRHAPSRVQARHVVLALPPRLMAERLQFTPPLSGATLAAMQSVSTWMAREAKSLARFEHPFWLLQGQSGSAFVSHAQAVLREVWDASDEHGAALAGFHAMPPEARQPFERSMPLLVGSQWGQLFGPQAQADTVLTQDWAREPWTCGTLDLADPSGGPPQADPLLRRPHWGGRLFFGGTETARQAAGHMEGALESVARLVDFLRPVKHRPAQPAEHLAAHLAAHLAGHLADSLRHFHQWVATERQQALPVYRQHVQQMLSRQDRDRVTQRAIVATVEQTYSRALEQLAALDMCVHDLGPTEGPTLTPRVLSAFAGFSKALVEDALQFNAGSCALSNFQDEHHPDALYLRAITADLAAAWMEFATATHDLLHTRLAPACS